MARFIILELLLFLAPAILFFLYVKIFHRKKIIEALDVKILTILIILGAISLAVGALFLSSQSKHEIGKAYYPATIENNQPRME